MMEDVKWNIHVVSRAEWENFSVDEMMESLKSRKHPYVQEFYHEMLHGDAFVFGFADKFVESIVVGDGLFESKFEIWLPSDFEKADVTEFVYLEGFHAIIGDFLMVQLNNIANNCNKPYKEMLAVIDALEKNQIVSVKKA